MSLIPEKTRRFSPILVVLMTVFIDVTGFGIVFPLLPFYAALFKAGSVALGFVVASFALMQFISSPILGRTSDKFGRRPVLLFSILTSVASFLLFALANSFLMLLLSRIVAGLATEVGVAQAYISDVTTEGERTRGMGKIGAAQGAGFIIGPAIGGFLSNYGFSAAGFAAALLALFNLCFAFFFLPETKKVTQNSGTRFNGNKGFLRKLSNNFSKPMIGSVLVILFIMSLAFSAFPVIMPLLAISFFDISSFDMSIFFVYMGLVQIVFQGLIVGRLAVKIGEEKLLAIGSPLMTVGVLFMALLPNLGVFLFLSTIMMIGVGILSTTIPSFISKRISPNERGGILGVTQSVSSIARVPGPLIGGFIFEFAGAAAPFLLSALLLLVATALGIRIGFKKRPITPQN